MAGLPYIRKLRMLSLLVKSFYLKILVSISLYDNSSADRTNIFNFFSGLSKYGVYSLFPGGPTFGSAFYSHASTIGRFASGIQPSSGNSFHTAHKGEPYTLRLQHRSLALCLFKSTHAGSLISDQKLFVHKVDVTYLFRKPYKHWVAPADNLGFCCWFDEKWMKGAWE